MRNLYTASCFVLACIPALWASPVEAAKQSKKADTNTEAVLTAAVLIGTAEPKEIEAQAVRSTRAVTSASRWAKP